MSAIDRKTVEHVAHLARLSLSEEDVSEYQDQLSKIIEYIDILNQLQEALEPDWRFDLEKETQPLRSDEHKASFSCEDYLNLAPKTHGSAFQVPKIIE